ncbi:hypothetical protein PACTADRAFT_70766 [Pachysolen tannophilus NRRL Y-2460]|uniref:Porphobilinogen deaminase n=1 Tax=Pachysolen tannophilus NRRL Y-2460 TaxID=669874 RepID=A0A1E4TR44_PACTA|nr:hypothetical protein PACTADRAFT_70766 [Pachysolen tannophilus NRRL Y-2460]
MSDVEVIGKGAQASNHGVIKIGTRKSALAVVQAESVAAEIQTKFPGLSTKITALSTLGDQMQHKPLYSFGGKSLWTKELEILLLESVGEHDKIDLIVHCLKDMPTSLPDEFELGCILEREDPRDALVMKAGSSYKCLGDLPDGSVVGTSSVRRSAQLLKNYPRLRFKSVRGNIQTRISKLDDPDADFSCLLLAAAGLIRMNLHNRITQYLDEDNMHYAVGQGALALEIRKGDEYIRQICSKLRHDATTYCGLAERSLLRFLEGGCSLPIGCITNYDENSKILRMKAMVVSCDGTESVEQNYSAKVETDDDAEKFGIAIAQFLLDNGAKKILDDINYDKIEEIKQAGITKGTN